MYNFGRDEARLWRSTTPRATPPPPLTGSQVSLRRRLSGDDAADLCLPRERAVDVPANFVAKPSRGTPDPPPPAGKKKKRKLPRLKIRFTRKKRSAQVEWPAEALEAAAAVERAASASPSASFADLQPHGVRGTRLFPALGERPPHVWADDVTSSGLGSSWETGLSVCSSAVAERSGLARHPSLRPSVRRFLRAGYRRSGSPSADSFRRTVSCPYELSWGAAEPEHPAVPLGRSSAGTGDDMTSRLASADADAGPAPNIHGAAADSADAFSAAETEDSQANVAGVEVCDCSAPSNGNPEDCLPHSPVPDPDTSPDSHTTPSAIPIPHTDSSTFPGPRATSISPLTSETVPPFNPESAAPSPSVSVERTFASQLAHHRPVAAGIRHYWKVRHEEERLGTFHVQEASVPFEHLPRNIQPFVLYHRPLVAEIREFWARRRKALRDRARNHVVDSVSEENSAVDGASGGGDVGDVAVGVSVRIGEDPRREGLTPVQNQSRDISSELTRTDSEADRRNSVSEPDGVSDSVQTRPPPDADSVDQVRAGLGGLQPLVDFGYVLPSVTRARPTPPRRARTAAVRAEQARTEPPTPPGTEATGPGSGQDAEQVSQGLRSEPAAVPEAPRTESLPKPAYMKPEAPPAPAAAEPTSATGAAVEPDTRPVSAGVEHQPRPELHPRPVSDVSATEEPQPRPELHPRPVSDVPATEEPQPRPEPHPRPVSDVPATGEPQPRPEPHPRPVSDVSATEEPQPRPEPHPRPISDVSATEKPHSRSEPHPRPVSDVTATGEPQPRPEPHPRPVSDVAWASAAASSRRKRTPPVIVPAPAVVLTSDPAPTNVLPADNAPGSVKSVEAVKSTDSARLSSNNPSTATVFVRASSLGSSAEPRGERSSRDVTPPDSVPEESRSADASRSSSFASARSFWRSLQDLRPIQESERLRKKVSFRAEQVEKRRDPVAVFFRHLLHKSESAHDVNRPPPAASPPVATRREVHRFTLPVEPRRRLTHTNSLPNAVVARVEPKSQPETRWIQDQDPEDRRWIQDREGTQGPEDPRWIQETSGETPEEPGRAPVSPTVRRLRQMLGSKPVQPVAPYHLERLTPATASSRRFIRPGVVRQLQAQFESLARQHRH